MSIKRTDIVPGTIVITTEPKRNLAWPGNKLVIMGEDYSWFDGHAELPFGTTLIIRSEPKRRSDISAQIVELETIEGRKFTTFLSYLKPRVELVPGPVG